MRSCSRAGCGPHSRIPPCAATPSRSCAESTNRFTLEAAERLREFDRPTLIAWATEDRFFKLRNAKRLAEAIPNARLKLIEDARTFVPLDQPKRLAELISAFIEETAEAPAATGGR